MNKYWSIDFKEENLKKKKVFDYSSIRKLKREREGRKTKSEKKKRKEDLLLQEIMVGKMYKFLLFWLKKFSKNVHLAQHYARDEG